MPMCYNIMPETIKMGNGHEVACHLYQEKSYAISQIDSAPVELKLQDKSVEERPIIQAKGLKVYFDIKKGLFKRTAGYIKAVDGVDISISKGSTLALVGESGCGKTTMGKALLQLIQPADGSIIYDGVDLLRLSGKELLPYRRKLQIIFQDPYSSLNPRMMVGEIIQEGMSVHNIGSNRKERRELVEDIMKKVGLDPDMVYRYPHEFSGGQRQRIVIARCLAVKPEFLICDEATSALDVSVQAQILNLLKDLQQEFDLTYLFITHDLSIVEYFAHEVMVMYLGRIVEQGLAWEIFDDPKHPYTKALLSAIPRVDPKSGRKIIQLEGDVPSPSNPPKGCHFHSRCPYVKPICKEIYPEETRFSSKHICRCYIYENRTD
ncbi:dipeptide ABC transporter ATP-binding protein [Candidatus Poribacteria bacterium]|nr:dipeptide ABC transporter ATP-binding protein [Candidatus Poribacteria bacterium]